MKPLPVILIVDDLAANRDILHELLGEKDYEFIEAADGPLALALAAFAPPDLVLLDVLMPDMDGFEVCRRMRENPRLAEVPIMIVTALDDRASRLAGIEAGADDFASKPFDRLELRARVRTITRLNRYRRLSEQRDQFEWVVEHARDGYVLVNSSDEILFANARARLWLGLSHPTDTTREVFLTAARRTLLPQPAEAWLDWPAITHEDHDFPRLLVRPETTGDNAHVIDVTVHENTGSRLLRLADVADRISVQRDQRAFQTMVQHKLRTPLNSILGPLELLTSAGPTNAGETATLLSFALQGAERLHRAVEDVLHFANATQHPTLGASFPLPELTSLVGQVAGTLGIAIVTVQIDTAASARELPCSRETVEWILFELMENARKFHPRHQPTIEIVARSDEETWIALSVSDDGVLLSPEQIDHLGRPFFQGEKLFTGETPGMGLGLASIFALVWQTGGSCVAHSRPIGPGLRVELRWPHAPAARIDRPPAASSVRHLDLVAL